MCDRHGGLDFAGLTKSALNRRTFLKASALGTIVMAVPAGMMGLPGSAHAASTIKGTHGNGFCNVAFFITTRGSWPRTTASRLNSSIPHRLRIRSRSSAPDRSTYR
jgi:hypothetical protein